MIYFCLVAVATPSPPIDAAVTTQGSFCIDACCPETAIPRLVFGPDDRFGEGITVMQNKSRLTCSGEFEATDVRIAGTSTTVADLIGEVAALRSQLNGNTRLEHRRVVEEQCRACKEKFASHERKAPEVQLRAEILVQLFVT